MGFKFRCIFHDVELEARRLKPNRLLYFGCPIEGCDYIRAHKWGDKNRKRK